MPLTSAKLFTIWAAKHKESIALQEELERALRDGAADTETEPLARRVQEAKAEADRLQDEALALFRAELKERGLT